MRRAKGEKGGNAHLRSTSTGSRADLFLPNASNWSLREENTGSGAPVPFKKSPKIPTTASFPGTKNYVKLFFNCMKEERKYSPSTLS